MADLARPCLQGSPGRRRRHRRAPTGHPRGRVSVPRLVRVTAGEGEPQRSDAGEPWPVGSGTVLVTGGTGGLGSLVALTWSPSTASATCFWSPERNGRGRCRRSGGAAVRGRRRGPCRACDVGDRDALAELIAGIGTDHPLTAVVHTAGVAANGVIGALTPEQVDYVLGPKADAAWHLHELTRDLPLTAFVLYSSSSSVVDGPGQGNYAAANQFPQRTRRAPCRRRLPAKPWPGDCGRAAGHDPGPDHHDVERTRRWGMSELSPADGLELLDLATGTGLPAWCGAPGPRGDP
ncbi:KR domain-containing protein [Streptomyces sp. SHP22-7]|nr:KR domain-containing protein [Streptomyces sp. SHP22-7]